MPARQEKLAAHLVKVDNINRWMTYMRTVFRNTSNSDTVLELQAATKVANKGRVAIGLPLLELPQPAMSSVSSAQSEFWSIMTADTIDFARAGQGGIGTYRSLTLASNTVTPSGYNWTTEDNLFRSTAQFGIRIMPVIYGDFKAKTRYIKPGSSEWGRYEKYIKAFVLRYGPGGQFWRDNKAVPYFPVNAYEIWNEPNLRIFSPGGKVNDQSVAEYIKYFVGVSKAIKKPINKLQ